MIATIKGSNLLLRFILELVLLFALSYWGFHVPSGLLVQILLGIGLPLLAAIVWGIYISPKAPVKLPLPAVLLIEALLFAAATMCLILSGFAIFAVIFACAAAINRFIILRWKHQDFNI
ncbi:YrdB family protein [Paenibacillus sp. SAFN-054]|uniref:YrdB family protein n=1 Tax=Paenibacillus sp. SAFN-054 TaxID=3436865 RepID=UPI003F805D85